MQRFLINLGCRIQPMKNVSATIPEAGVGTEGVRG